MSVHGALAQIVRRNALIIQAWTFAAFVSSPVSGSW
jgi:hypothetical protein